VALIGKMADIVWSPSAERIPCVDTDEVLARFEDALGRLPAGLVAVNVQELDLAGHRESCEAFVEVLAKVDRSLERVIETLSEGDLLLITGDHGDDPTYGRLHTREEVPLLAYSPGGNARALGTRRTLADVGASIADWLGAGQTRTGESFADQVR
jgi:phosphopentomutase